MRYILILCLLSSCYTSKMADRESFIKAKIDIKQKYIEGKLSKCEHDWLMLTYYEMYYK